MIINLNNRIHLQMKHSNKEMGRRQLIYNTRVLFTTVIINESDNNFTLI